MIFLLLVLTRLSPFLCGLQSEKGIPTISGKSKSDSKDKERKHKKHKDKDKEKDKEHKKHKHRHKDRSKDKDTDKEKKKDGDHSKKHHDKVFVCPFFFLCIYLSALFSLSLFFDFPQCFLCFRRGSMMVMKISWTFTSTRRAR